MQKLNLVQLSKRAFLDKLKLEGVSEKDVTTRIDDSNYLVGEHLNFDMEGKHLVFDALDYYLASKPRNLNLLLSLGGLYFTYGFYFAVPFSSLPFYLSSGFTSLILLTNMVRYADRKRALARMWLLKNGTIVRLLLSSGTMVDVPISGIKLTKFIEATSGVSARINNTSTLLRLRQAKFINPSLLYAILLDEVHTV